MGEVQSIQQWTQHTSLFQVDVGAEWWGEVRPYCDSLWVVSEEVPNAEASEVWEANVDQFCYQSVRDDFVECQADIDEKKPGITVLVFQIGQGSVQSCGYGIIC